VSCQFHDGLTCPNVRTAAVPLRTAVSIYASRGTPLRPGTRWNDTSYRPTMSSLEMPDCSTPESRPHVHLPTRVRDVPSQ